MTVLDLLPPLQTPASLLDHPDLSGLRALVATLGPVTVTDQLDAPLPAGRVLLLVAEQPLTPSTQQHLQAHLAAGGRAVLAVGPDATGTAVLARPAVDDPLVMDPHLRATGTRALDGLELEADDLVALPLDDGDGVLAVDGQAVTTVTTVGAGILVTIGSVALLTNRWLAAADNAVVLAWAITGTVDPSRRAEVRHHLPRAGEPTRTHAAIETIANHGDDALLALLPEPGVRPGDPAFIRAAGRAGRLLSAEVHDALSDFADGGAPAGAILLRGLPVGDVPPTPASPLEPTGKDHVSEFVLLTVARRLGQPIGYEPEHGGDVVQNLLPTPGDVARQTSTSSGVELEFHTETAFHPHKPRFLLLLCLRGDPDAQTLLCSVSQVVDRLPLGAQQVLREPRYRTGIDESFTGHRSARRSRPMAVLGGTAEQPTFTFDADLMTGLDDEATDALEALRAAIRREHVGVALEAGDLLVVDNSVSVHGRSSFTARFDGTDRWLQRTFVVTDLAASATQRRGRVITTRFV